MPVPAATATIPTVQPIRRVLSAISVNLVEVGLGDCVVELGDGATVGEIVGLAVVVGI